MQITRQRVRPEMHIETAESCPTCRGTGKVQPPILFPELVKNELSTLVKENQLSRVNVHLHPFVACYLKKGINSEEKKWRKEVGCRVKIHPSEDLHFLEYRVFDPEGKEIHRKRH